jgi:MFS transporter, DHA1 family, inner membrane transport protein
MVAYSPTVPARDPVDVRSRWLALIALALGAFAIGCTEFVAVGLLPQIADDLQVSQGTVGQLVTLNAVAVAFGAPLIGAAVARRACRPVLVLTLVLFAAAHVLAALAPVFAVLLVSRLLTGAAFGLFLAVAFAAAARLAPDGARAGALATVQGGITTATALGVPLGMLLGQSVGTSTGWRLPFLAIGALALLAAVAIRVAVPALPPQGPSALGERLGVLGRRPVAVGIATIAVFWAGSFCAFTYLVPLLAERAGLDRGAVIWVVVLAGAMSVLGNVVGGRGADRALSATLLATAALTLLALVLLFVFAGFPPVAVVLVAGWQLAAWSFVPAAQARIYELGGEAGVSFSVAAFNVGIVAGAGLGGLALDSVGLPGVGAVTSVLAAAAVALTAVLVRLRA